mmetsp:Transcript_20818/g.51175  ORF Transcript_20818/g.51175 Transcript_20818/m.51175 type:complete len:126 (-) Transcript_20818:154-531(-)
MSAESRAKTYTDFDEALKNRSFAFRVDLSNQGLKCLPPEISSINKVEHLNLSNNDLDESSLTSDFFELHNLQDLDLSYNHFKELPACICMFLEIRRIDVRGNQIEDPQKTAKQIKEIFPSCEIVY